eukprot:6179029-Pleurochrysis_carterae.AAC.1
MTFGNIFAFTPILVCPALGLNLFIMPYAVFEDTYALDQNLLRLIDLTSLRLFVQARMNNQFASKET